MINPSRMVDITAPVADQLCVLISRLRRVLHEETTHGERAQVLIVWSAMLSSYGEILGDLAQEQEARHIVETADLNNVDFDQSQECQDAAQEAVDEALERHQVRLNPLES